MLHVSFRFEYVKLEEKQEFKMNQYTHIDEHLQALIFCYFRLFNFDHSHHFTHSPDSDQLILSLLILLGY